MIQRIWAHRKCGSALRLQLVVHAQGVWCEKLVDERQKRLFGRVGVGFIFWIEKKEAREPNLSLID